MRIEEVCSVCGEDLCDSISELEPEEGEVLDDARWGRHPSYESTGVCPRCDCGFKVWFDTEVSVETTVAGLETEGTGEVDPKKVEEFFAQSPGEYKFPRDVRCEHCRAQLQLKDRTAKEAMDRGMRIAMEFPIPRVTCQVCAPK
ncbi:MAG: hypothetical protein JEY79_01160 [Pseudodesulfovibrio sp.]|nr:hypothetical protein [Pseudodesulfovibrio sp.]